MARRPGLIEDLFEIGSHLSWRMCLVTAPVAGIGLHLLAVILTAPTSATTMGNLGSFAARNLIGTIAYLMQFVIPLALLVGALVSYFRRSQAGFLFQRAALGSTDVISKMSWPQFERLIGEAFRRQGFQVQETGRRSADGGVDLILVKEGNCYLVQCKNWRSRQVGVGVVRELNGVIAMRKAAGGVVVTGGSFTREAWHFAQLSGIALVDGEELESMIREIERKRAEPAPLSARVRAETLAPLPGESLQCPKCGSAMVRRVARQGAYAGQGFWGCHRYPECRGTRSIL